MSRGRPPGSRKTVSGNEQVMIQVWHGLVDTLRLLPSVPSELPTAHEKKTIDDALEKISLLISLRRGETIPSEAAPSSIAMAPTNSTTSLGVKRKRRPSVSVSASPAPAQPPPLPTHLPIDSPLVRSGTPSSANREATGKHLKEVYADQLPLQSGRKVAFRVPAAKAKGEEDTSEESWILATIKRCILQDKMRYEVQDADDAQLTWNTTLRSIIPLPDPSAPTHASWHPSHQDDYPKGFQVLALYPDTTSFYRATVLSGGKGIKEKYRLSFVDDGDKVHEVAREMVVPLPT